MNNKLYVGNLPYSFNNDKLAEVFAAEVEGVTEAVVITDRDSGRSKGFGFVTFGTEEEARLAIEKFNGKEIEGRPLKVDMAQPRQER
ncbi:MAG: RNA-binding protein [bacterium]